jgi:fluoride exporter
VEREVAIERELKRPRSLPHREIAAIFCGGFIGAIARAALEQSLPVSAGQWPWATFAVNITGALLLGCFLELLREREDRDRSPHWHPLLATGFCGALSTFSTMMLELLHMIDGAHWALAFAYSAASVVCGLLAVWAGGALLARRGGGA